MIHDDCKIGARTQVWQYASVIRGAHLGDDCSVGSCAIVDGAFVGNRCHIGHGASVHPGAMLGNDVFVGPGAVICNDEWPRTHKDRFQIEDYKESPCVVVGDGASIGANCTVLPGVRIGKRAMVAAGMVVSRDVAANHLLTPAGVTVPITDEDNRKRMVFAGKQVRAL